MHFEFLRQLRERQDQTAVIPTIADILLAQFQEEQAVRLEPTFENPFLNLYSTSLSLRQMAIRLWSVLLSTLGRGVHLQGAPQVRPPVSGVCAAVQQQPAAEEDGHPRVYPHRHHQDHQVPAAHRAAHQDCEGPPRGATEASQLSLARQVNPH